MNRRQVRAASTPGLALLLALLACGRKEEAPRPRLAAPDKALASATRPTGPVPAAAEVSAANGPVKITLRLLRNRLTKKETSLWVQVLLANVGSKPILVDDEAFQDLQRLVKLTQVGVFVQVVDSTGKEAFWETPEIHPPPEECWSKERQEQFRRQKEVRREIHAELSAKGLSDREYSDAFDREFKRRAVHVEPPSRSFWLAPGKSTATSAMAYQSAYDSMCNGEPQPPGIGEFGELEGFGFSPGKYRIRLVYDLSGVAASSRKEGRPVRDWWTRVATPWMSMDVVQ